LNLQQNRTVSAHRHAEHLFAATIFPTKIHVRLRSEKETPFRLRSASSVPRSLIENNEGEASRPADVNYCDRSRHTFRFQTRDSRKASAPKRWNREIPTAFAEPDGNWFASPGAPGSFGYTVRLQPEDVDQYSDLGRWQLSRSLHLRIPLRIISTTCPLMGIPSSLGPDKASCLGAQMSWATCRPPQGLRQLPRVCGQRRATFVCAS